MKPTFTDESPHFALFAVYNAQGHLDPEASAEKFYASLQSFHVKTQTSDEDIVNAAKEVFSSLKEYAPINAVVNAIVVSLAPRISAESYEHLQKRVKDYLKDNSYANSQEKQNKLFHVKNKLGIKMVP